MIIITGVVTLVIGVIAGKMVFAKNTKQELEDVDAKAQAIIKEAELRAETY